MSGERPFKSIEKLSEQLDVEFALHATGLGIWELDTKANQVIWDDLCRKLFGLAKDNHLPYEEAIRHIHPEDVERVNQAVQRAIDPQSDGHYDQTYRTIGADDGKLRWARFYGRAYFFENGNIDRFAGVAHDVTEQKRTEEREVATRNQVQQQQRILESISANTPDLMYVFGLDYRYTYANQALLDMWGSSWENSIGKTLLENGYEPWHAQMHEREIDHVIATKQPVRGEVYYSHAAFGKRIYDYVFSPVLNAQGEVEAIAGTTRDITELINVRQKLEEKEVALSNAIDVAGLGTWTVDILARTITLSPRVAGWFGLESLIVDVDLFLGCIARDNREQVNSGLLPTLLSDFNTRYDQVYPIVNANTGHERIIHAVGKIYFNDQQQAVKIEGSAQDITGQRALTLLLEQQVQQRTDELATINEELTASNEELEHANELLVRSNEDLQSFAHVASHDLQEPLRKIQQFANLLSERQTTLTANELDYVGRMQSAANRMTILIRDLLNFSGVSTRRNIRDQVPLNVVVEQVLTTLDLVIAETKAEVYIQPLPQVTGDASQLAQLFQNLLTNAIKFHQPSVLPVVHIKAQILDANQLPVSVNSLRTAQFYHRVDVSDNGIGFNEIYLDRIFQVFQRLHSKSEFSGTGIGLAICERVVANHGGAITASSQPGKGATFSVFLPAQG